MRKVLWVLVLVLGLALVACGGRGPGSNTGGVAAGETGAAGATGAAGPDCADLTAGPASMTISDFAFEYPCLTVSASQGLTVVNEDKSAHTFTVVGTGSEAAIDATLDSGDSYKEKTLSGVIEPGTYSFFCRFHPPMKGTITVQ